VLEHPSSEAREFLDNINRFGTWRIRHRESFTEGSEYAHRQEWLNVPILEWTARAVCQTVPQLIQPLDAGANGGKDHILIVQQSELLRKS